MASHIIVIEVCMHKVRSTPYIQYCTDLVHGHAPYPTEVGNVPPTLPIGEKSVAAEHGPFAWQQTSIQRAPWLFRRGWRVKEKKKMVKYQKQMEAQAPKGTLYSTVQKQMTYLTDLCSTPNAQNINA